MAAGYSVVDVVGRIENGSLRPGTAYDGMTNEQIAEKYLCQCVEVGICAGCYNPIREEDRQLVGADTNICIFCACY